MHVIFAKSVNCKVSNFVQNAGEFLEKLWALYLFCFAVQGVSTRYVTLWSHRWPTKIDLQVLKKVAAHSGDLDIWVLSIKILRSNIGQPRQPLKEKLSNIGKIIKYQVEFWQPFLSEAVEASQWYFFKNRLIKLKCPHLLNVLLPFLKLGSQL